MAARAAAGIGLALVAGALAAWSSPPFTGSFLIFVAFVPMIVAQHRILPGRWSALAPGIAYGIWFGSQILPGVREAGLSAVYHLLPLYAGLFVGALSLGTRRFHEQTRYRWFWIATPVSWVALDFLRGSGLAVLGGTWANPVCALWAHPWFLQPLSIFWTYGLELLILSANWVAAGAVIAAFDPNGFPRRRAGAAAAGLVVVLAGWTALSLALLGAAPPVVKVAAIQPGPGDAAEELRADLERTRAAAAAGAAVVVWREAGLRFDPRRERGDVLAEAAREANAYLVAGFAARDPRGRRLNMAAVFAPDGRLLGVYGKDHPGTFAGDFSDEQGEYPVFRTAFGGLAAIICYDLDFTDTTRKMARNGAGMIAVPSNDAVPSLAETHYTHLVFRAIENRVSLIKADKMRDAAAIDPWGRVAAKTVNREGRASTLLAGLPWGTHDSPYVRLGDWAGWMCLLVAAAFVLRRFATSSGEARTAASAPRSRTPTHR